MGRNRLQKFTDNEIITKEKLNQFNDALQGDILPRNDAINAGDEGALNTDGEFNLGNNDNSWGKLTVNQLRLAGKEINADLIEEEGVNGILECLTQDGLPHFLELATDGQSITIKASSAIPLDYLVRGVRYSLKQDITIPIADFPTPYNLDFRPFSDFNLSNLERGINVAKLNGGTQNASFHANALQNQAIMDYLATVGVGEKRAYGYRRNGEDTYSIVEGKLFYYSIGNAEQLLYTDLEKTNYFGADKVGLSGLSSTTSGAFSGITPIYYLFLDKDLATVDIVMDRGILYSVSEPENLTENEDGIYWYNPTTREYRKYSHTGGSFIDEFKIPIGKVVGVDDNGDTKLVGYRCEDFLRSYEDNNTIGLPYFLPNESNVARFPAKDNFDISVYGKRFVIPKNVGFEGGGGALKIDLSGTDLANGELVNANKTGVAYITDKGEIKAEIAFETFIPVYRERLKGWYHPYKAWRAIGGWDYDSSGNIINSPNLGDQTEEANRTLTSSFDILRNIDFEDKFEFNGLSVSSNPSGNPNARSNAIFPRFYRDVARVIVEMPEVNKRIIDYYNIPALINSSFRINNIDTKYPDKVTYTQTTSTVRRGIVRSSRTANVEYWVDKSVVIEYGSKELLK